MSVTNLICIVCPRGCSLVVDGEAGTVAGNSCPRGAQYGIAEVTAPMRTLTSTARVVDDNGDYLDTVSVRTKGPIPKDLVFDAMKQVNALRVKTPIRRGDVLIPNILETGVDVVATRDIG